MKTETRVISIVLQMGPLADFLKRFRPSCKEMSIRKKDYAFLLKAPDAARKHGVIIDSDEQITFRGFKILTTNCNAGDADGRR
jgi:hypothetical protein